MISLNNTELVLVMLVMSLAVSIVATYIIFKWMVYRDRSIAFPLYAARDELIHCVATGAIKSNDKEFQLVYNFCIDLINIAHTDFFNFRKFMKFVSHVSEDEKYLQMQETVERKLKAKNQEFVHAVIFFNNAILQVFIRKSIFLRLMIRISILASIVRQLAKVMKNSVRKLDGHMAEIIQNELEFKESVYKNYFQLKERTALLENQINVHYGT